MAKTPTAVRVHLSLDLSELKTLLLISDATYDARLTLLLSAAKEAADLWCQNEFLDDDGVTVTIPDMVKMGVVMWCKVRLAFRDPTVLQDEARHIRKVYRTLEHAETAVQREYWTPWKVPVGF